MGLHLKVPALGPCGDWGLTDFIGFLDQPFFYRQPFFIMGEKYSIISIHEIIQF